MPTEDLKIRIGANLVGLNRALNRSNRRINNWSANVTKNVKRVTLAFTGLVTAAGIIGAKFDKEMRFVGAITNATADEFEKLTAIAEEMGRTTEFTATQSAEGLRFLGMAGLTATQAIEALPPALDLATAGEMNLARAADIATNILSQFSLEVKELTRVNDVLAKVQSSANTNIEQAAEAFVYGGTIAKQFNMEIEELAGFVGLLANRGIKASLAGTTLRQAMIKLLNPSKEATEVMQKYGLTITDAQGNLRNFTDVILDMVDAQVSTKDSAILLGARASQLASIFNMTTDEIISYIRELENAEGTAKNLADSIRESFWGKWKEMISKLESTLLQFFKTFESTGKAAFETIGMIADELRSKMGNNAQSMQDFFIDAFAAIIIGAASVQEAISGIANFTRAIRIGFKELQLKALEDTLQRTKKRQQELLKKDLDEEVRVGFIYKEPVRKALTQTVETIDRVGKKILEITGEQDNLNKKIIDSEKFINNMNDAIINGLYNFKKLRNEIGKKTEDDNFFQDVFDFYERTSKKGFERKSMLGEVTPIVELTDEMKKRKKELSQLAEETAYGIASPIGDAFLDIIKGTKKISDAFKDMANQIISEILRIAVRQAIITPLAGAIGGFLFPGVSFHKGGIVGSTNAPQTMMPSSLWDNAPRLHNGLKGNEFPAILEKGEKVISKKDVNKPVGNTYVTVKIENPVYQDLKTQQESMSIIAETVVRKSAPTVIYEDYINDGISRDIIRGGI